MVPETLRGFTRDLTPRKLTAFKYLLACNPLMVLPMEAFFLVNYEKLGPKLAIHQFTVWPIWTHESSIVTKRYAVPEV